MNIQIESIKRMFYIIKSDRDSGKLWRKMRHNGKIKKKLIESLIKISRRNACALR